MDTPRNLQLEIEEIFKNTLNPFFKEYGFKKNGNSFNKSCDGIIQVVNIQKSKWNRVSNLTFTVNIGFFIEILYKEIHNKDSPKVIRETDCHIQFRLSHIKSGKDNWYELNKEKLKENLVLEIENDLKFILKPLLEKNKTLKNVNEYIQKQSTLLPINPFLKLRICLKSNDLDNARKLFHEEYNNALNPQDTTYKTVYPNGAEIIQTVKGVYNEQYAKLLKEIALENNFEI